MSCNSSLAALSPISMHSQSTTTSAESETSQQSTPFRLPARITNPDNNTTNTDDISSVSPSPSSSSSPTSLADGVMASESRLSYPKSESQSSTSTPSSHHGTKRDRTQRNTKSSTEATASAMDHLLSSTATLLELNRTSPVVTPSRSASVNNEEELGEVHTYEEDTEDDQHESIRPKKRVRTQQDPPPNENTRSSSSASTPHTTAPSGPATAQSDEDLTSAIQTKGQNATSLTEIHCGIVRDGKRIYREQNAFFASVVPIGDSEYTISQPVVNVYTAVSDQHRRVLYCCGDLAKRFEATNDTKRMNKVGMWMSRRKELDGVFQASSISHKEHGPSSRAGLKTSGYFFTIEIAKLYQQHVLHSRQRMEEAFANGQRSRKIDLFRLSRQYNQPPRSSAIVLATRVRRPRSRSGSVSSDRSSSVDSARSDSTPPDHSTSLLHAISAVAAMVASEGDETSAAAGAVKEEKHHSSKGKEQPQRLEIVRGVIIPSPKKKLKSNLTPSSTSSFARVTPSALSFSSKPIRASAVISRPTELRHPQTAQALNSGGKLPIPPVLPSIDFGREAQGKTEAHPQSQLPPSHPLAIGGEMSMFQSQYPSIPILPPQPHAANWSQMMFPPGHPSAASNANFMQMSPHNGNMPLHPFNMPYYLQQPSPYYPPSSQPSNPLNFPMPQSQQQQPHPSYPLPSMHMPPPPSSYSPFGIPSVPPFPNSGQHPNPHPFAFTPTPYKFPPTPNTNAPSMNMNGAIP